MIVYLNGEFLDDQQAKVSVFDRGFLFGDGVYEGLRCFNGRAMLLDEHAARLRRSLSAIGMASFDPGEFASMFPELLERNGLRDAGMYWQVTRGADDLRSHVPTHDLEPTRFACVWPMPSLEEAAARLEPARIILLPDERWLRCDIKSTNLLPNTIARTKAEEAGAIEAVFHRSGFLSEGASSSVFVVRDGALVTTPIGDATVAGEILHGTVRQWILDLAAGIDIPTEVRPIPVDELTAADEVIITSSTKLAMPVVEVDDRVVGEGEPGDVYARLREAVFDDVRRSLA